MADDQIKTALISVYDKTGIVDFSKILSAAGIRIVSTSKTADMLRSSGIVVTDASRFTGFPEILGGRVKTLHPKIAAGILARADNQNDDAELSKNRIERIGLVVVNFYPFEKIAADPDSALDEAVENVDIGGPAMLRAAAKNFSRVAAVCDPGDYPKIAEELSRAKSISIESRRKLAAKAFEYVAAHDAAISSFLHGKFLPYELFPQKLPLSYSKVQDLRYGENPHQKAALYKAADGEGAVLSQRRQLWGKELSYNNILDIDAAVLLALEFLGEKAAAIIKHNNPCGVAVRKSNLEAYSAALSAGPVSAFGGVVCFNTPVEKEEAKRLNEMFLEIVIAPGFSSEALETLKQKKNLRVIEEPMLLENSKPGTDFRSIVGGMLAQERNSILFAKELRTATKRAPAKEEMDDLVFAWKVCKHVKSNAIVYAKQKRTVGIGAGQASRVDSARFAVLKAKDAGLETDGCAMASDAFFPFRDSVDEAAKAGITSIIQPGGSIRDEEVVKAADEHGMAMVLTGTRMSWH